MRKEGHPPIDTIPSLSVTRRVIAAAQQVMQYTGIASVYCTARRPVGAKILMYHSVPPEGVSDWLDPRNTMPRDRFERQVRYLARCRRVVPLGEIIDALEQDSEIAAGTVVLTFDDGYLDNLTVVAPILAELRLPAVIYLATGYIDRAEPQWIDQLYTMFRRTSVRSIELDGLGSVDMDDRDHRLRAYLASASRLLSCDPSERMSRLEGLHESLDVSTDMPRSTMNWDDVRKLRSVHPGFEIGVHTHEHVDLTACSLDDAEREIRTSIQRVRDELGIEPMHFSFPYGRADAERSELVRRIGLKSAVVSGNDVSITSKSDPCRLARVEAPRSAGLLRFYSSGAYPNLSLALMGRA